jgi:hypothetical protein
MILKELVSAAAVVGLLLTALTPISATAGANGRKVTVAEARQLVLASLDPQSQRLPGLTVKGGARDSSFPDYYSFAVMWDGTSSASVMVGFFDVDPLTGDVFEGTGCGERTTPLLRALQTKIRHSWGLSDNEYRRLKKKGPYCE